MVGYHVVSAMFLKKSIWKISIPDIVLLDIKQTIQSKCLFVQDDEFFGNSLTKDCNQLSSF